MSMTKPIIHLFSILMLCVSLIACQATEEKEAANNDTEDVHTTKDQGDQAPEKIEIEGVAHHYHTGDSIELTALLDEETEYEHWHWYSRKSSKDQWEVVSGQETERFTAEATVDGLEIKAVLFNNDHEPYVQSAPITIIIDDHHGHDEESRQIYQGYFEDDMVEDRELSDWDGDWQSVYPYLLAGDLDQVFEHKAEDGDMTAEEYKDYYTIGYQTDVDRIVIENNLVTFYQNETEISGEYAYDGYEILTYEKGNRGVRFIYQLVNGSEDMPQYIQFSDHNIFPVDSHHYHLYWGDDREELLEEVTNWPTYYPSHLDADGLVRDMLAH